MKKRKLSDRAAEFIVLLKDDELAALRVNTIASYLGVNSSYLSRKFNNDKKMTLNEFITGEKMHRSAILLSKKKKTSIASLTEKTGFSRADYFVVLFRKKFGIHPKRFGDLVNHKFQSGDFNSI